jgi:hypothetical protein
LFIPGYIKGYREVVDIFETERFLLFQSDNGQRIGIIALTGVDIDLAWLPGEGVWPVRMDAAQIGQILINLGVHAWDSIAGIGRISTNSGGVQETPQF